MGGGEHSTHGPGRALPGAGVLFPGQASPWGSAGQCQSCPEQEREASRPLLLPRREPSGWQDGEQKREVRAPQGSPRKGSLEKVSEEAREAGERAGEEAEQLRGSGRAWELCRAGGGQGERRGRRETKSHTVTVGSRYRLKKRCRVPVTAAFRGITFGVQEKVGESKRKGLCVAGEIPFSPSSSLFPASPPSHSPPTPFKLLATQSVVPGPAAWIIPRSLLGMQNLRPYPDLPHENQNVNIPREFVGTFTVRCRVQERLCSPLLVLSTSDEDLPVHFCSSGSGSASSFPLSFPTFQSAQSSTRSWYEVTRSL